MLTSDLIRIRHSKGTIIPRYIKSSQAQLDKAAALIELYKTHVGRTRGELEEAIKESIGDGTDFLIQRGLAKLLADRSTFAVQAVIEPRLVREKLFTKAFEHHPVALRENPQHWPTRQEIIASVAQELQCTPDEIEQAFYADLQDAYVLETFEELKPAELINRYNIALAQGVLYRAKEMRIVIQKAETKRLRQLVRYIKFFRLIANIQEDNGTFRITLDGPLSLFRFSQKYGLKMAQFLPALLLCEHWEMESDILWEQGREQELFKLDAQTPLRSYYKDKGVYVTDEEAYFRKRWKSFDLPWELRATTKVLRLGPKELLLTDYRLKHRDSRMIYLEILGFWNKESLLRRLKLLEKHQLSEKLLMIAPARLRVSSDDLAASADKVYFFKDAIIPKKVVEFAERLTH